MTEQTKPSTPALTAIQRIGTTPLFWAGLALIVVLGLYLATMARTVVYGDPTEYTFVAQMLGIAHPPGYAFFTLLGKLFQLLIPIGAIPWRMHLLSVVMACLAVAFVYGIVLIVANQTSRSRGKVAGLATAAAIFAGLSVATAADWWQHALHANPHLITATFLAANLFFLTQFWARSRTGAGEKAERWLLVFCLSASPGITHHPLTVFSWPAYGLFILAIRPRIWRQGRLLLKMAALFLLGLAVWLYYPVRSAMAPAFGPDDMNTLSGFLDHILARGLTESLPFYGLADQFNRLTVFWSLLRLQYTLPLIFLAALGLVWLGADGWQRRRSDGSRLESEARSISLRPLAILFGLVGLSNYLFVINLRAQDIMAYLLGIFLLIGLLAGIGLWGLLDLVQWRLKPGKQALTLLVGAVFLLGPVVNIIRNLPVISLADYDEAERYREAVFDWFSGEGEEAILLNDWEHMTPLWYAQYVDGKWPDPTDVTPVLVSTKFPWLESVFYYLPDHPVYLSGYRSEIVGAGFRLRPRGPFYQVVQPGDSSIPPELTAIEPVAAGALEFVAVGLPENPVVAGDYLPLVLAMRTPTGTEDYYVPALTLGEGPDGVRYEFTTDSHLITPLWKPGEVIIDRFDLALPADLPAGSYPLSLDARNLSTQANLGLNYPLGELVVADQAFPRATSRLLANFRQRVGLVKASAREGLFNRRTALWTEPLVVEPGDVVNISLEWASLAPAEESYSVFVHLIDLANQPLVALDYTPLGGATPTHLWIPKWLPGQEMLDPYRLEIPEDLPPGEYLVEIGLYEMTGKRRLLMADPAGNLIGDRYILGAIQVQE